MNEHEAAREALELAAVEPGGLDRLEAGDTGEAAAVVGHLAGCAACLDELGRLRRVEALLRPAIAELPDPALRDRTLAFVREVGVQRPPTAAAGAAPVAAARASGDAPAVPVVPRRPRFLVPAWLGSLAAVLVIGVAGGSLLAGQAGPDGDAGVALAAASREAAAMAAAGDMVEIALADADGTASGTVLLSPPNDRALVLATGLEPPPDGAEYRCWVEVDGQLTTVGTMEAAGDVAWWAGDLALPATLPDGVTYGVSLVEAGMPAPGRVVLSGSP